MAPHRGYRGAEIAFAPEAAQGRFRRSQEFKKGAMMFRDIRPKGCRYSEADPLVPVYHAGGFERYIS